MSHKYCIIDKSVADGLTQSQVDTLAPKTVGFRDNLALDKSIVEYVVGSKPDFLTGVTAYTKSQMQAIVRDSANGWQTEDV